VIELMNDNLQRRIAINDFSEAAHLSQSYGVPPITSATTRSFGPSGDMVP
jgi:hypothetical protein